jgi:hypothetical protein
MASDLHQRPSPTSMRLVHTEEVSTRSDRFWSCLVRQRRHLHRRASAACCSSFHHGPLGVTSTAKDYCQRVTEIWGSGPSGQWSPLKPATYPAEAALHDLVQKAPQMLPLAGSPQLAVLGELDAEIAALAAQPPAANADFAHG